MANERDPREALRRRLRSEEVVDDDELLCQRVVDEQACGGELRPARESDGVLLTSSGYMTCIRCGAVQRLG